MTKVETKSPKLNALASQDLFKIDEDFLAEFGHLFNKPQEKIDLEAAVLRHTSKL